MLAGRMKAASLSWRPAVIEPSPTPTGSGTDGEPGDDLLPSAILRLTCAGRRPGPSAEELSASGALTLTDAEASRIAAEAGRRRTFAIISHPDAGKTTLTEKLLLFGGAIHLA